MIEAAQRDRAAFAPLYERYVDQIFAYAHSLTRNRELAEDVTAATFAKAIEDLPRFEWRGVPYSAWLYRVASNLVARQARRPAWVDIDTHQPIDHVTPEAIAEQRDREAAVRSAVALLPDDQRQAVVLRFGGEHGLSEEQIAGYIEAELKDSGAQRLAATPAPISAPREPRPRRQKSLDPKEDFMRMLRLSGLDTDGMADETRDAFVNMAENLGIDAADAEELVDLYLEETEEKALAPVAKPTPARLESAKAAPVALRSKEKPPVTAKTLARSPSEQTQKPATRIRQIFSCSCGEVNDLPADRKAKSRILGRIFDANQEDRVFTRAAATRPATANPTTWINM